ncbi:Mbov_0395 family pilin-like conjugal transfer protein [Mesomycoplasma molare]|uniref:Preprotein translocase subunit SecE n=1 Tax=Mesomycoplasma molare TaxID=171288 RepID=A0ABY5TVA7_9BACT|nr:hypothetical protein [Mesomycoplasma molare]UWD34485.1 hypothetical protein NX772_01485 [Mesomycoplasma molare]
MWLVNFDSNSLNNAITNVSNKTEKLLQQIWGWSSGIVAFILVGALIIEFIRLAISKNPEQKEQIKKQIRIILLVMLGILATVLVLFGSIYGIYKNSALEITGG